MIEEILSAQNSPSAIWARRDLAKENEEVLNNEDYRKRRLLEMQESGATARTGMNVAGNADVENIKNIGAMARQQLGGQQGMELGQQKGEFDVRGHEITAAGNVEAHNLWAGAERYKADAARDKIIGGTPEEQNLLNTRAVMHSPWAKDRTPEEVSAMISKVNTKRVPGTDFVQPDSTSVTSPAAYHPPTLPGSAPPPARKSLTGGQSMEFRSGISPEEEERRKKESERRMFYGTKFSQ
jgi:hypothetical protein